MQNKHILTLTFSDQHEPELLEVSNLLYGLNVAYEFYVLIKYKDWYGISIKDFYSTYPESRMDSRPKWQIEPEHRLKAFTLKKQSPLVLEVVVPLVACAWALLQMFLKVRDWPLEREKLELEIQKLRREENKHRQRVLDDYVEQLSEIHPVISNTEKRIVNLLSKNIHKLTDVEVKSYEEAVNKRRQSDA